MRFIFAVVLLSTFSVFGQNRSVDELRKSNEIRKNYIDNKINSDEFFTSKSLYVDPFIGTGGHGHTYPGAAAPFGMMQLSPDTRHDGWDGCSGYHYSDSIIYGFSHTHLSGTGVPDYCDLLIIPQLGIPKIDPGYLNPQKGYGDRFSHEQENASPGFYEVKLLDQEIICRMTVTERAGMHEYTFLKEKGKKFILIDLDHRDKLLNHSIIVGKDKRSVSGSRNSHAWASNQHFYFHLETSTPFQKSKLFIKNGQHKLLLTFHEETEQIKIKIGMSSVDIEGAINNLKTEIPDWDFNYLRSQTVKKWDKELGVIDFKSAELNTMIIFYSALYHSFLQPNLFSDIDGRYRGRDNKIHRISNDSPQYTVFSLWDTYRATHPLYTLIQQDRTNQFINTFLRQFDQSGDLPVWELAGNETDCMIGYHSASVIADAWLKGIRGFDGEKALAAMVTTSEHDELGKKVFRTQEFIGSGDEPESVSKTLEYSYDDFCIAQMATSFGKMDIYQKYYKSSLNFINLYDPETKFMRARRGAMWYSPFDPTEVNFNYTEANSYQYSLYAPHAIDVITKLMGGKDSLESWLDRLFTTEMELSGRHQVDITGLIGQYAHGNEPSHHMAYLYNYTNHPEKTQYYIDKIFKEMYSIHPDGLSGNEDCGQMSSWYILSALGIYQVTPGHSWYDIGRPLMNEAKIHFEDGKELTIKVKNNSSKNKYIQSFLINGQKQLSTQVHHGTIMNGGNWEIIMGPNPVDYFQFKSTCHSSENIQEAKVPIPYIKNETRIFDDSILVKLGAHPSLNNEKVNLYYRFSTDTTQIYEYKAPFAIHESCKVEINRRNTIIPEKGAMPGLYLYNSPWVSTEFIQRDKNVTLDLKSKYDHQYASSGPNALIDGVEGGNEFRTGDYQGYWAQDLVSEVTFSEARVIKETGISCLQDMKSWIFYPSLILVEISVDGTIFKKVDQNIKIPEFNDYVGPTNQDFTVKFESPVNVKKIRITARNYGKCPQWHLGAGNDTWLFSDELIFR